MIRRAIDIVVAAVLLILTAPLQVVAAVLNWMSTRRVFFRQTRIGQHLVPFVIVKFQTMVDGAEAGTTVTTRADARVTPLGRVLRALKLDELPQLINVLRGEMSLVGPRPLTPNEVAAVPSALAGRVYASRPGMTGIAALVFIDEEHLLAAARDPEAAYFQTVLPRKIALELAYARRRTWLTDLAILAVTPVAGFSERIRRAMVAWLVPQWLSDAPMMSEPDARAGDPLSAYERLVDRGRSSFENR